MGEVYEGEMRGSVVVSMPAWQSGDLGSIPGPRMYFGVKTWLSTLEIVCLCVFWMKH